MISCPSADHISTEMQEATTPFGISYRHLGELSSRPADNVHRVQKGTAIRIPISAVHRDTEVWGADAAVFKYVLFLTSEQDMSLNTIDPSDGIIFPRDPARFQASGGIS
jgi:hypothetical protein